MPLLYMKNGEGNITQRLVVVIVSNIIPKSQMSNLENLKQKVGRNKK